MPNISNISVPLYDPLDPYHHEFDNAPLKKLITRQELINGAVDSNTALMVEAIGDQGTLSNRLNQSLESDGSLKKTAVDDVDHNIGSHVDGLGESSPGASDSVPFVRMKQDERDKLSLIESESNSLVAEFTTPSTTVSYTNGNLDFEPSDSISWHISNSKIYANTTFPATSLHQHVYTDVPVHSNLVTPDYINYKVNTVATPFISGSLRVYINGTRLTDSYPSVEVRLTTGGYKAIRFVPGYQSDGSIMAGRFYLFGGTSVDIPGVVGMTSSDKIIIDYDTELS